MSSVATKATIDQARPPESVVVNERDVRRAFTLMRRIAANPYIAVRPTPHQVAYLLAEEREALFTGSGGNGKSTALMASALLDVDRPGYRSILVQRTLAGPVSLAERSASGWSPLTLHGTARRASGGSRPARPSRSATSACRTWPASITWSAATT